mgnify:CR=1 FL=1
MRPVASVADPEVNGLLIDQTRTRIGQDFYRHFCTLWGNPNIPIRYNIVIKEIPDARWGSFIAVEVNGRPAYRTTLRPRSGGAEEAAKQAIPRVRGYLRYLIDTNGGQDTEDLKGDGY